jgi:tRNA(Ile)-lysidine synthase
VYSGDVLVAVGDLWVCEGYTANSGEPGFKLVWK